MESAYILKVGLTGFADGLGVGRGKEREESKRIPKFLIREAAAKTKVSIYGGLMNEGWSMGI